MLNSGYLHIAAGAYVGQLAYNAWLSPKVPAGIMNDLARAATITVAIVLVRKTLGGKK
jgi:hypothetical protein